MAKTGFEYIVAAVLTEGEDGAPSYAKGMYLGPASTFNGSPTNADVKDYGDDRAVETESGVTGGTLSIELNERTLEVAAHMLGHKLDEDKKTMEYNAEDIAPYLGIGAIGKSKRNNARKYTGKFYYKTQFHEPSDENATKQENVTFTHTTLEGNIFMLKNGKWKTEAEFDTLAEAKTWLEGQAGMSGVGV